MKTVLLVEDNEDDMVVMKMACQRTGIPHALKVVRDGNAAVDYLIRIGDPAGGEAAWMVDLIFLDLKLPGRDGHEVLEWIRGQPGLKNVPVVMLTAFSRAEDVDRAYSLGVTSFLRKTAAIAEFGQAVRVILKYWLELNIAPPEPVPSEIDG
jgi:CheY-like chemotaxis protein